MPMQSLLLVSTLLLVSSTVFFFVSRNSTWLFFICPLYLTFQTQRIQFWYLHVFSLAVLMLCHFWLIILHIVGPVFLPPCMPADFCLGAWHCESCPAGSWMLCIPGAMFWKTVASLEALWLFGVWFVRWGQGSAHRGLILFLLGRECSWVPSRCQWVGFPVWHKISRPCAPPALFPLASQMALLLHACANQSFAQSPKEGSLCVAASSLFSVLWLQLPSFSSTQSLPGSGSAPSSGPEGKMLGQSQGSPLFPVCKGSVFLLNTHWLETILMILYPIPNNSLTPAGCAII